MSGYVRVRTFLAAGGVVVSLGVAFAAACAESPGDQLKSPAGGAIAAVSSGSSASGGSAAALQPAAPPTTVIATPRSAPELVQQAIREEMKPRGGDRKAMLDEAVRQDPDYAPARWQSGYVRMGKQWLSTDEVARRSAADPRLTEYARLREKQSGTPEGELAVARWCRKNDLPEQARFHWLSLLQLLPNHEEALRALGMRWRNGSLVAVDPSAPKKEQPPTAKRSRGGVSETRSTWQSIIAKWERLANQEGTDLGPAIRADLADRLTDRSLQLITTILAERSRNPKASDALRKVNFAWIEFLKGYASNARYLVAIAMWHPTEEVRNAAADALKDLPKESYVPLLLACAKFPVEFHYAVIGTAATFNFDSEGYEGDSHVEHTQSLVITNPQITHLGSIVFPDEIRPHPAPPGRPSEEEIQLQRRIQDNISRARLAGTWQREVLGRANQVGQQVERYNAYADQINKRVTDALSRATETDLAADPRAYQRWWQDYWYDYFEIEKPTETPGQKATYITYSHSYDYKYSCFHRSTEVWTLTGPMPIHSIRPGDRVLSQNPTTGELAYKTVLKVTTANPTPMVRIRLGAEEILATRGHPFWVVGQQWRMAKQLEVGSRLHTPDGAVRIDDVQPVPLAETADGYSYNLVVDDFHTYFVGQRKVLVHHLTMLSILDGGAAGVPGMASSR